MNRAAESTGSGTARPRQAAESGPASATQARGSKPLSVGIEPLLPDTRPAVRENYPRKRSVTVWQIEPPRAGLVTRGKTDIKALHDADRNRLVRTATSAASRALLALDSVSRHRSTNPIVQGPLAG